MPRRRFKKKEKRTFRTRLAYSIVIAAFISLCFIIYSFSHPTNPPQKPPKTIPQPSFPKATIVDHLSISHPNQTFVLTTTDILKTAGFTVDYYSGEEVTVDFYRNLPAKGYGLIVLRVHSAIIEGTNFVGLFTSELYDENKAVTTYFGDVMGDRLVRVFFTEGDDKYFGISPKFVESSMNGRFNNTTVIMMGCDGLRPGYTTLARAFVNRGAKVYIGWSGPVTSTHSDGATIHLLKALVIKKETVIDAIIETLNKVGPDPAFLPGIRSELLYYPIQERDYVVQVSASSNFQTLNCSYSFVDKEDKLHDYTG